MHGGDYVRGVGAHVRGPNVFRVHLNTRESVVRRDRIFDEFVEIENFTGTYWEEGQGRSYKFINPGGFRMGEETCLRK